MPPRTAASVGGALSSRPWIAFAAIALAVLVAAAIIYLRDTRATVTAARRQPTDATNCPIADVRRVAIGRADAVREIDKTPAYTQGLFFADGFVQFVDRTAGRVAQIEDLDRIRVVATGSFSK